MEDTEEGWKECKIEVIKGGVQETRMEGKTLVRETMNEAGLPLSFESFEKDQKVPLYL